MMRELSIGVGLAGLLLSACTERGPSPERPNIVLFVVDTLRADAILDPAELVDTPAVDALIADGVSFTRAFSHAPMTLPSHTALFSSRHPFETGIVNNGDRVDPELPLLHERLEELGWATRAVVSLGTLAPRQGLDRGFGRYEKAYDRWMVAAPAVTEAVEAELDELAADQPFFLFAHYSDPHLPYNAHGTVERTAEIELNGEVLDVASTSDMTMWKRTLDFRAGRNVLALRSEDHFYVRTFEYKGEGTTVEWEVGEELQSTKEARIALVREEAGQGTVQLWLHDVPNRAAIRERYVLEVEAADRSVGRVLDGLRERGLYDDALIVFTSDHGEGLGDHSHTGHVQNLYDEQLHVPLVIKLPSRDRRIDALRARHEELMLHVDLAPTLLDLVGAAALPGQRGRSLLSSEPGSNDRVLIAETHKPEASRNLICLRDLAFKMVYDVDSDSFELYDLAKDRGELRDVFEEQRDARPEWIEDLRGIAAAWKALAAREGTKLDPDTEARLEALGY